MLVIPLLVISDHVLNAALIFYSFTSSGSIVGCCGSWLAWTCSFSSVHCLLSTSVILLSDSSGSWVVLPLLAKLSISRSVCAAFGKLYHWFWDLSSSLCKEKSSIGCYTKVHQTKCDVIWENQSHGAKLIFWVIDIIWKFELFSFHNCLLGSPLILVSKVTDVQRP